MSLVPLLTDFANENLPILSLAVGTAIGYSVSVAVHSFKKSQKPTKNDAKPKIFKFQKLDVSTTLVRYLKDFGLFKQDPALDKLKHRTMALPGACMLSDPICTQLMALLGHVGSAETHIEVGTYTGYNLLQQCIEMKERMGDNFKAIALDVSSDAFSLTKHHFAEAKIGKNCVDFRCQPAIDSLQELLSEKDFVGKVDTIFIDADKQGYLDYYEKSVQLLRPGGVIFVDNCLWSGKVPEFAYGELKNDKQSENIHAANKRISEDHRVKNVILPIGDGLNVVVKL